MPRIIARLQTTVSALCLTLAACASAQQPSSEAPPYEIGGPLEGVALPLFPTQHGEPAGYPGVIPNPEGGGFIQGDTSQSPQLHLYPGSVENFRAYYFHYVPIRSYFDRQSLLQHWQGDAIPGSDAGAVEPYAPPLYFSPTHGDAVPTGRSGAPVPVLRVAPGETLFNADLGGLPVGLYTVRVVGAVQTDQLQTLRKPLYLRATVNDGLNGEVNSYRLRLGYVDEFYSVAEVYFHAPVQRAYQVTLAVESDSAVDLLVHTVDLHDVMASIEARPIKQRRTLTSDQERAQLRASARASEAAALPQDERLQRDALLWQSFPRLNAQLGGIYGTQGGYPENLHLGAAGQTPEQIAEQWGAWQDPHNDGIGLTLMRNDKLDLQYTLDDLSHHRKLPEPYPFGDDGAGLYFPAPAESEGDAARPQNWQPISDAVMHRAHRYFATIERKAESYHTTGNTHDAHDAAVMLARFAYQLPAMDAANTMAAVLAQPGAYGRDLRSRRRETMAYWMGHHSRYWGLAPAYDKLFDYIDGNEQLAASIQRFVPWVRTPDDVVTLFDSYLMQTLAKRIMRYHYRGDGRQPSHIAEVAAVMGDAEFTRPWMRWLFNRTFYYPNPVAGIQDLLITATDRDGRSQIGSRSYMLSDDPANVIAEQLEVYINAGGDETFDLRDIERFPKTRISLYFPIRHWTAGLWFPRIGNVTGPDKSYAAGFNYMIGSEMQSGWRWTRDPAFAYPLYHYGKQETYTDAEWAEIKAAAESLDRAPWMENASRVLPNWAGFLETGLEHDDFRFRRSAMLRVGVGWGHHHNDVLDLQIHAHGLPITTDAGQRPGYSSPNDRSTKVHNTVEVDGQQWWGYSWIRALSDAPGARYMAGEALPLNNTTLFRRQIALIDVHEGEGSQKLQPQHFGPDPRDLPKDVVTPASYVFDVFRAAGGSLHTYAFHSNVNDPGSEFEPTFNAEQLAAVPESAEGAPEPAQQAAAYLNSLSGEKRFGVAPDDFAVLFQLQKERVGEPARIANAGTEHRYLHNAYDPDSPVKYLKLHMPGLAGAAVLKGDLHCTQWGYYIPNIYVQRRGENLASAFGAIIEPYAGEPFVESVERLTIADNEDDALQAVAMRVRTVNGHDDLLFADGRPERERQVTDEVTMAGEFAYYSTDAQGLRHASLAGGTLLDTPHVRLVAAQRERVGKVVEVDYSQRTVVVEGDWPSSTSEQVVEIGTLPGQGSHGAYVSTYTATAIEPMDSGRTRFTFQRGADFYRSSIVELDATTGTVTGVLDLPRSAGGMSSGWTATNDQQTRTWRVEHANGNRFRLAGNAVSREDFGEEDALRLWEYGVDDTLRQSTFVSLRRVDDPEKPGVFELTGNVGVTLSLAGTSIEQSTDGETWQAMGADTEPLGKLHVVIDAEQLAAGPVYLRVR